MKVLHQRLWNSMRCCLCVFFQAEDGIRVYKVTGVQTCALPIYCDSRTAATDGRSWHGAGNQQSKAALHQIDRIQKQLHRIDEEIQPEKKPHVEPSATHYDSETEHAGSEQTRDRASCWESRA